MSTDFFQPRPAGHFPDLTRNIPTALIGLMQRLKFSAPATRFFKGGEQAIFRSALVTEDVREMFWANWRRNRIDFARIGLGVSKDGEAWICNQWLDGRGALTSMGKTILANLERDAKEDAEWSHDLETWEPSCQLPPEIAAKLFGYQILPARQILHALMEIGGAIDGSDMGTGKTFQTAAAALATGLRVGVICPKTVIGPWHEAFKHFGKRPLFISNWEKLRTGNTQWVKKMGAGFTWEVDPDETVLIWDECHKAKTKTSLNGKLLQAAVRDNLKNIAASGTVAVTPEDLYATGQVVKLHDGSDEQWRKFLSDHGVNTDGTYDKRTMKRQMARLNRVIWPKRGARVRIQDLGDRFPETQILCQAYTLSDEDTATIEKAFEEAQRKVAQLVKQGTSQAMAEQSMFIHAYHAAERAKLTGVQDLANEHLDNGRSVAIFMNFNDTREAMMEAFKTKCAIFGGQSQSERDKHIKAFKNDESRIIVCNLCAGGVGVSLHDTIGTYPRTSIILPNPRAVEMRQGLGRVHRAGGVSKSMQIIYFSSGTVETAICRSVRGKLAMLDSLNDGDLNPKEAF